MTDYEARALQLACAIANDPDTFPDVAAIAKEIAQALREAEAQGLDEVVMNLDTCKEPT